MIFSSAMVVAPLDVDFDGRLPCFTKFDGTRPVSRYYGSMSKPRAEHAAMTMVALGLLNLDEAVTKE
jgi:hypothetical protein